MLLTITLIALIIFYIKFSDKVPILMYHRIANIPGDRNSLPPEKFEQQLRYLHSAGYTTINMEQLYAHYAFGKSLPKKAVVLTFDDGYVDNLSIAMPLMKKHNMIGNVFAITNWIGMENRWENFGKKITRTMNKEELLEWVAAGNYVGSHTCNHPSLVTLNHSQLTQELYHSKKYLTNLIGTPINSICYPYGKFDDQTLQTVKDSNYKIGLAIFEDAPIWNFDILALPRIPIPSGQKMWEFKLKVSKIHMIFVILRRMEKSIKHLFR